jgi:GNAT superfamily N-acetyltransferase
MVTLIHAMKKRGKTLGLATLCGGGGVSLATAIEVLWKSNGNAPEGLRAFPGMNPKGEGRPVLPLCFVRGSGLSRLRNRFVFVTRGVAVDRFFSASRAAGRGGNGTSRTGDGRAAVSDWNIVNVSGYFPGLLGRVTELHGRYYHRHWGFDLFFEAKVATEMAAFLARFDPARDGLWVSMEHDRVIGSVAICGQEAGTAGARLRWLLVEPEHPGRGLGKLLVRMPFLLPEGRRPACLADDVCRARCGTSHL